MIRLEMPPAPRKPPVIDSLCKFLRPSIEELTACLLELRERLGYRMLTRLLNVSDHCLTCWIVGKKRPGPSSQRLIWLTYCMVFEPEKVDSLFHILTWGKFAQVRKLKRKRRLTPARPAATVTPSSTASDGQITPAD